ncbi:hypothetical protein Q8P09_03330 [Psychrobacter faecalis]|uniref:Uncharacterized protein n=1 Tax=Psychrobacter faecalis TaxID=180588 RepID=A0ABT9HFL1_9GAMM|nr:hypothetical protein [Psychrobacter faecalis]MDP4544110.1 hypothetical protein [Psychrobacter faecalis]
MSESSVTTEILEDRILITQVSPSGRKSNAATVELSFKEWVSLSDAINKELEDKAGKL